MKRFFKFFLEEYCAFFQSKITLSIDDMCLNLLIFPIDEVKDQGMD